MSNIKRKKILYIHHGKGLGGAPLSLLYLIKALDKKKYHPIVLFLHYSDAFELYKKEGIEIYGPVNRYDFPHTKIWWFRWYHIPYFFRTLRDTIITYKHVADEWLTKLQPDLVHLNTSALIAWAAVARKKNLHVVWHIREPLAPGYLGLRRWFIKKCVARYATTIIPICHNDAQPWQQLKKTTVIHNPVDPTVFNPNTSPKDFREKNNLSPDKPTILFLGGVSQEKGTLVILIIFEKLLQKLPNAHLLIAGYWDLTTISGIKKFFPTNRYKKKIAQQLEKVKHAVTILGPINSVPQAMAASTVVVFPATQGHFARPVIEAGFMKKPVVASLLPPLDELVVDKETGFLVPPHDINQWIEKLSTLLHNNALQKKIGYQAHTFCLKNYSLTFYEKKITAIYQNELIK